MNLINVLFKGENRRGFALMLGDAETVDGQPRQYWLWPSSELRFACYYSADQIPDNQLGYPTGLTDPRNVLLDWWDDNANIKTDSTVELLDVTAHPQDQDFGYQVYVQDETEKGILPWFQSSFPYHLHPQFNLTFTCESFNLPRTSDFKKGWYYVMVDWNVEQQSSFGCFAMNLSNDVLPQPEIKFRYGSDTFPGHNTAEISAGVGKVIYIHVDNTQPVQEYYFYDTSVGTDDRLYTLTGIGENSVDIGVGSLVEPTLILRPSKIWQNQRYTIEMTAFNGVDVLGSKFYTVEFVDVTPDLVNSTQFTGSLAMGRTSTGTDPSWQRRERVVTEEINGNDVGWFAGASVNGLLYPTVVVPLCKVKTKTDYIVTLKKSFLGTVYEVMYDYTMRCNIGPSTSSYIWPSANGQVYGGDALNSLITIPLSFKNHYQGLVMIEIVIKFDLNTNPIAFPRYQEVVSWLPALSVPLVNQMVKTRQVEGPQRADSTIFLTANDGNTYSINVTDRGYHLSEDERLRYYGPTFITFFGSFLIVGSSLTASLANVSGMNGGTGLSEYFEILPSHVTEGTYFGNTGRFVRFRAKSGSQGQIFRIKCCSKIKASLP